MSSFTKSPPLLGLPPDYKMFEVQVDFKYYIGSKDSDEVVEIKKGTKTDGASIPKIFWSLIGGPLGPYAPAAVVHDVLYVRGTYKRRKADKTFLEAMAVLKVRWWRRRVMHLGVRIGGWLPWNRYRKQDK
jgi:hypothetical protein